MEWIAVGSGIVLGTVLGAAAVLLYLLSVAGFHDDVLGRAVRRLRYDLSRPPRQQTCKDCWRGDGLDFHVPTDVWNAVVVPQYETFLGPSGIAMTRPTDLEPYRQEGWPGVLCLECFDRRAKARGVDYSGVLAIMGHHAWLADGAAMRSVRGETPTFGRSR
jgi:hypothetical protein